MREFVMQQLKGIIPPLVTPLTDQNKLDESDLESLVEHILNAVVMAAPYYYPIGQEDLRLFTQKVAKASPLPLYIYNMPNCTKVVYEIETLERLAECETIKGVKDSGGDMVYFHRLLKLSAIRPDWSFLIGPEEMLAEAVLLGGHGGVCGGANLFPQIERVPKYWTGVQGWVVFGYTGAKRPEKNPKQ